MTVKNSPNCGKCGLCLNVCPVYGQTKEEPASPRAKMQLIRAHKNNTLPSSAHLKEIISKCLMCGACAANCPSGIDHYTAFMNMREKMTQDIKDPLSIRSLIYLLSKEYRLNMGASLAKTGQKLLPDKLAQSLKLGRIPMNRMPTLNNTAFRHACPEVVVPDSSVNGTVIYFTGCATHYLFDDTGFAAIGILKAMGFRVIIPKTQACCGIPLLFHGAAKQAQQNIKNNIGLLKDIDADAILTDCSTCAEALKHIYPNLFQDHGTLGAQAIEISRKTTDIFNFIDQNDSHLHLNRVCRNRPVVTYHAPCHSRNRLGIHLVVEKLLEKLPCTTYRKTPDMEECCGGGGTFFYEYPDIAEQMVRTKTRSAKAVNADIWATDCPVCRLNLGARLENGDRLAVTHPLTLIHSALEPR
jgi:glycolate oxidase iron-sulfur subunit